jgi:hypothetical protein
MENIEKISAELFNKIRSRFDSIETRDEQNKTTDDPEQARFFHFNYVSADGQKHGLITIALNAQESTMKVEYHQDIPERMDEPNREEWKEFILGLRRFAKRNRFSSFDIRDINRQMTKRDVDQTVKHSSKQAVVGNPVTESVKWSGTTRTSVQEFGPVRLVVRHTESIKDDTPLARSRRIESMFVETDQGERFRMPHNRLNLGRAMAQHIAHGGRIYDEAGLHIQEMAEEMQNLALFVRNTRHRQFEDTETQGMVETAIDRYKILRADMGKLSRRRGYEQFAETFSPERGVEINYDIDALKERFVRKMFDDRLTTALPYVYRAYQQRQVGEQRYVEEFESWTDNVLEAPEQAEPDWALVSKVMARPLKASGNGMDAYHAVDFDDEDLRDMLQQAAHAMGPEADLRPVLDDWFIDNYPEYTSLMPVDAAQEPESGQSDSNPAPEPSRTPVEDIRRLAGIK